MKLEMSDIGEVRNTRLPSMPMIMVDPVTKAHFRKEKVTTGIDGMKRAVEALQELNKSTRSTVPLNPTVRAPTHEPESWVEFEGYTQAERDAWDALQADEAQAQAEQAHHAAIGKGGTGGKGKGRGKGKGKGKGAERVIIRDPNAPET